MIGLIFFGAIALWGAISVVFGSKLPNWFGIQRCRILWTGTFTVLVFFIPVADEIIAYPQIKALCEQDRSFRFSFGMDEKKSFGRTVYSEERNTNEYIFPSSIKLIRWSTVYVDAVTKEDVLMNHRFIPIRGMLGIPNGSGGGKMTILLHECLPTGESFNQEGIPNKFNKLNLKKIPKP